METHIQPEKQNLFYDNKVCSHAHRKNQILVLILQSMHRKVGGWVGVAPDAFLSSSPFKV